VRDAGILDIDLESQLRGLLHQRNWLVHHSKRESRGVLNDSNHFDALVGRLDRLADDATALNALLGSQLEEHVVTLGVDQAAIDREAKRNLRKWGY
jgi:hypothetical protein